MRRLTLLALTLGALFALGAPVASAHVGLENFDVVFEDDKGGIVTQAGAHPFAFTTTLDANTIEPPGGGEAPDESVKDLVISQMPGFAGNQTAVPRCSTADFLTPIPGSNASGCPDSTAVGLTVVEVGVGGGKSPFEAPIYNLEPPPGKVAKLGFWVSSVPVSIVIGVSEAPPYRLVVSSLNTSQTLEFFSAKVTVWGNPADPVHDPQRGLCYNTPDSCPAGIPQVPFITTPRSCTGPLSTIWEVDSWQNPGIFYSGFALTHDDATPPNPQGMSGCGKLGFGPRTAANPTSTQAESSSGLDFEVLVDDEGLLNPDKSAVADADIAAIRTALPAGVTLNPSAAEGLGICTIAQFAAERLASRGCPDASKLGTVEATTPLLEDHPLRGSLYLGAQNDPATPGSENPFDSFAALYLVIRDPELGVFVKQAGEVALNAQSGQVITTFSDLPPFPLSRVSVNLRSGPRAPLITPTACGTYTTLTTLTPSSGAPPLQSASSFQIDSGVGGGPCPAGGLAPFAPGFEAGSLNNAAGSYSPFYMRLTRADGSQDLTRFSAALPPGVSGKIAGIPNCPDAAIAAAKLASGRTELASPSCPAASRIGRVVAGAGVGTALTYVPGSLYLAGPYNGAPLSVVAVVPAVAGPFDVGTVVTRVALRLNPNTAEVEVDGAASDPIPHMLEGIPLKVRDIRLYTDRPEFTLNPTSCAPATTRAEVFGSGLDPFGSGDDAPVAVASRYQAASCASLPFKPKLKISLKGKTKRSANTALEAVLNARAGDANLKDAVVTLPPSQFVDNAHINNPCTRAQFAAGACPASSVLGSARAFTPLLDAPLEGKVYFRANGGERQLPDVVAALRGQFDFNLVIAILSSKKTGRVTTKVLNAPDAPVTKFVLKMAGGKKGLLENSENLCRKKQKANFNLAGQNGRRYLIKPVVKTSCKKKKRKQANGRHSRTR